MSVREAGDVEIPVGTLEEASAVVRAYAAWNAIEPSDCVGDVYDHMGHIACVSDTGRVHDVHGRMLLNGFP